MTQLTPIQLDDHTVIYMETEETLSPTATPTPGEVTRTPKGPGEQAIQQFEAMQNTIRAYTTSTLNAFKAMGEHNPVDQVTLEFGIKVAGEGGIPFVTKGTAQANLKISVQCSFRKNTLPTEEL